MTLSGSIATKLKKDRGGKVFFKLKGDTVNVYYISLDEADPAEITGQALECFLDEAEKRRLFRFKAERRKKQFVVGRMLVKKALADQVKLPVAEIRLGTNQYGKLYLDSTNPQNLPPIRFNLSHAGKIVACSVALHREIGIDVENIHRVVESVGAAFFHRKEIEYMERIASKSKTEAACRLWTLKEAYVKAKGRGLLIPLSDFNVLDEETFFFHSVTIENDYYLSVAVENPERVCFQARLQKIDLSRLWSSV